MIKDQFGERLAPWPTQKTRKPLRRAGELASNFGGQRTHYARWQDLIIGSSGTSQANFPIFFIVADNILETGVMMCRAGGIGSGHHRKCSPLAGTLLLR